MPILLISPPRTISKGNIWKKIDRAVPPLGLAYIGAYLEKRGMEVSILDLQAEHMNPSQFESYLKEVNPDFIGIGATTVEINGALTIAKLSKKIHPGTKIVFGGVHPSIMTEEVLLNPEVDFVVRGEGEETLHELVSGSENIADILGLSYREGGIIKHNHPRPVIADLNEMPMPAYHLLPMDKYKPSMGNYKRLPAASMIATRGCPGRCTFCYTGISGNKTRTRSAMNLLEETKLLQKDYKIKEISFYDDTFTAFKENIKEFCEGIIREKIDITWTCMSRIDFVDEGILRIMKRAGCHQIGYGLESASLEILRNIRKPIQIDLAERVVRWTMDAGIDVRGMFMIGNPGETEETIKETINFAIRIKPDLAIFNITTPFPGTEMYAWAKKNGYLIDMDWDGFDLSNVVMSLPTIPPERIKYYYKAAYKKFYIRPFYLFQRLIKMRTPIDLKNNARFFFSILDFERDS